MVLQDEEMRGAYTLGRSYQMDATLEGNRASRLPEGPEREQLTADVARWSRYAKEHETRAAELEKTTDGNRSARAPWPRQLQEPSEELRWAWHDLEQARQVAAEPDSRTVPRLSDPRSRLRDVHQRVNMLETNEARADTELGDAEPALPLALKRLREILSRP